MRSQICRKHGGAFLAWIPECSYTVHLVGRSGEWHNLYVWKCDGYKRNEIISSLGPWINISDNSWCISLQSLRVAIYLGVNTMQFENEIRWLCMTRWGNTEHLPAPTMDRSAKVSGSVKEGRWYAPDNEYEWVHWWYPDEKLKSVEKNVAVYFEKFSGSGVNT